MADDSLKVRIEAQVANYDKIVQTIKDGIEKGLVDGISDKALAQLTKRLETVRAQLNVGSFEDAIKSLQRFNVALLRVEENINTAAGAASSELARLTAQLNEAKLRKAELDRQNPASRYRKATGQEGQYVLAKSGVDRAAVGMHDEVAWKSGKAVLNGQEIDYGGTTWSIQSAIRKIVEALNEGSKELEGDFKRAIEAFGYTVNQFTKDENGKFVVPTQPLATAQRELEINAWRSATAKATADVQSAELAVKEATANVENITVTAETGSFTSPIPITVALGKEDNRILDDLNKAKTQTIKKNHDLSAANEEARDKQDRLNSSVKAGTNAFNGQQNAVSRAVTTFFGYQMVLRQLRRLWREAIHTIKELDKQLTTQAMVTGMTRQETWGLVQSYQEIAQATGLAQTTIAGVTTEYLRQGESLENALTLTKAAAAAATVAGISASDSVKYLTTAIHGFKLEAEDALEVSDKFAALAASAATNYEDLAVALSKVASQASLAGMSMDYTLALLTTGLDVTQEAPESIGTALKTVIARMREISDYGKTLEDDTDLNQVENGLRAVGIALKDGVGELRSTQEVLDELGNKWATLTANQQAAVAKALAGTRQQSRLVAIMENYDKVLDYQQKSMNSIGATTAQQVTYLEGMEAATNNLQSAYQSLIQSIVKSDEAIGVVNTLRGVLQWIGDFLKQPAGRIALISTIATMLLKSKQLMERIKSTVDQLIASLSQVRREERQILDIRNKELTAEKQLLVSAQSRRGITSGSVRPNGWLSNDPSKAGVADILQSLGQATRNLPNLLKNLLHFGSGWGSRTRNAAAQTFSGTGSAIKSWWQNNSLVGKIRGAVADRKTIKQARESKPEYLIEAEQKLAKARQEAAAATKAASEVDRDYAEETGEGNGVFEREEQAKKRVLALQQQEEEAAKRAAQRQQVLSSSQISTAEKMDYLARDELITKKEALLQNQNQTEEERKKTQEDLKQLKLEQQQTQAKAAGGTTGAKLSQVMSKVSGYVAMASTAIAMVQEWVDIFNNFANELANQSLEQSKRIQAEMYQNTQLKSTIASTSSTISKLSKQVVKTTEDLEALDEAQNEFAEAVGLSKEEVAAMSADEINNLSQAKQMALDEKNRELAKELNETLTKASYNRSGWEVTGNILGKTAMGAGAGAAAGGWGALAGAIVGLVVGAGEEITRAAIAADAKNKINALLETDEGVEQFKYALKLNYRDIAQATEEGGKEMAAAMSAMFSSVVELFDADDLKSILERFNYDMAAFAQYFNELLGENIDAIQILSSDKSSISQRVKAAEQIRDATAADKELNSAFLKINSNYLQIGDSLTDASLAIVDAARWSLSSVSAVVNAFNGDIKGLNDTFEGLDAWLQSGAQDSDELAEMVAKLSSKETAAIKDMITAGRSLQDVADINTRNRNKVSSFRETQAKWGSMSESEQQRFIDENIEFFTNPEYKDALSKFLNGEDITQELAAYQQEIQQESRELYEQQRQRALWDLAEARESGKKELIAEKEAYLAIIEQRLEGVDHMFDLSLSEIVDKQNEQLEKLKEMYQAEEEALVESLNKRKEAYQKYFDDLAEAETVAEYAQSRDQLIENIAKLSSGSDAASKNKVRELQKQLATLEKEEMQRQKEEARQAVLDNIDKQVEDIQQKFTDLLDNNQALLATMNNSTKLQYLQYLQTLGLTDEDYQLRVKELSDLLDGQWNAKGLQDYSQITTTVTEPSTTTIDDREIATTNITVGSQTESVELSKAQMNEFIKSMLGWLNANAGTSFKY